MVKMVKSKRRLSNQNKNEIKPMDFFKVVFFSSILVFFMVTLIIAGSTPESKPLTDSFPSSSIQKDNRKISDHHQVVSQPVSRYQLISNNSCSPWPKCTLPPREPSYYPLCDLLLNWSPNDPDIKGFEKSSANPSFFPRFDFSNEEEYNIALQYRKAELPFIVYNLPQLDDTKEKWTDDYLRNVFERMNPHQYTIDKSTNHGHLLYYSKKSKNIRGYVPPQQSMSHLSYKDFEEIAIAADTSAALSHRDKIVRKEEDREDKYSNDLLYLTISANIGGLTQWIVNALSYFRDNTKFFRVNYPSEFHGINCRFGMRGIVQVCF